MDLLNDDRREPFEVLRTLSQEEKTTSWLKEFHGYKRRTISGAKFERIVSLLLLLVLLAALIAWGIVVYERMRKSAEDNLKQIHALKLEFERYKQRNGNGDRQTSIIGTSEKRKTFGRNVETLISQQQLKTTRSTTKSSQDDIYIKITGNGQLEKSVAGQAIHSWNDVPVIHTGNIEFRDGRYLKIMKSGLYFVYAQMFFGNNTELLHKKGHDFILDFAIVNRYKRIVSTSVPLISCKSSCTSSVSQLVKLKEKDFLSVQTFVSDQTFNMYPEKVYFGTYKVK